MWEGTASELACAFCGGPGDQAGLGPLLGPVGGTEYHVHRPCALWSPEVHESENGTLLRVLEAVRRGRQLKCAHCGRRGASTGCRVEKCRCTFHAPCAQLAGATFYANHCLACPEHARRFTKHAVHPQPLLGGAAAPPPEEPAAPVGATPLGQDFPSPSPVRGGGGGGGGGDGGQPAAKRRRLEEAQRRAERAEVVMQRARKDQRRLAEQDSDDEGHFRNKEAARLRRAVAGLNPLSLGGGPPGEAPRAAQHLYVKLAAGVEPRTPPEGPSAAVSSVLDCDLSSLAGHDAAARQLHEMVLLPLLYPGLFERLGVAPPRGILFHGLPGTGKTLAARAVAGACARHSPVPVAFFARKGADCLGKFAGEAERTLRLLFQEAAARAPAIIFLDEIDALVPSRAATSSTQDQIHASVVSTLLSLMDGVADRGNVVVLAATNRPEAIDAALRRPGRFDREIYFGLPAPPQRAAILRVHTRRWEAPPAAALVDRVAAAAEGFAGADLAGLCTAAVMAAARRAAPALLAHDGGAGGGDGAGADGAARARPALEGLRVEARDWEEALAAAPAPCSRRDGLAGLVAEAARPLRHHAAPLLLPPLRRLLRALGDSSLPLPPAAAAAVAAAAAPGPPADLEAALLELGAVAPVPGATAPAPRPESPAAAAAPARPAGAAPPALHPPCRLLVGGAGERGQAAVAGAALRLLEGCPAHAVSLPTLVVEGAGDAAAGCVAVVAEALRRADRSAPCVLYLPRLETWAVARIEVEAEAEAGGDGGASPARGAGHSAGGAAAPQRPCAAAPSPMNGLVSLERRGGAAATPGRAPRGGASPGGGAAAPGQLGGAKEEEEEEEEALEVAALSDAWSVFESLLREAPPSQPLLVLATCHADLDSLPDDLLAFFGGPRAAVELAEPAPAARDAAVARAAAAAADVVAARATAALLERLRPPPRPWGGGGGAGGGGDAAPEGDLPQAAGREDFSCRYNVAEMERGRALYVQAMRFMNELGRRLLRDRRSRAAGAWVRGGALRRGRERFCSFEGDVARPAACSQFSSLDQLTAAAAATERALGAAAELERRTGEPQLGHPDAERLAHALRDEVDACCHALRAQLGLDDPATSALLAAAARQVAGLVEAQQAQQQEQTRVEQERLEELEADLGRQDAVEPQGGSAGDGEEDGGEESGAADTAAPKPGPETPLGEPASLEGAPEQPPAASAAQRRLQEEAQRRSAVEAVAAAFRLELDALLLQGRPSLQGAVKRGLPAAPLSVALLDEALACVVAAAAEAVGDAVAAAAGAVEEGGAAELAQACAAAVQRALGGVWAATR